MASDSRVIILGAGPVGLGAALELARFGVGSVLIEKHDGTSWHPKTRNFNTRTMEIARGWGPAVYKRLNSDRNRAWLPRLRAMLDDSDSDDSLVVVGAMHLLGEDGVVELLREAGYTVERL